MTNVYVRFCSLLGELIAICIVPFAAQAQTLTSLSGIVSDPQDAVIPGAVVTVSNTENGAARKVLTNTSGRYQFLRVIPGNYKLTAEQAGFSTVAQSDFKLQPNMPATLDIRMEPKEKEGTSQNERAELSLPMASAATAAVPGTPPAQAPEPFQTTFTVGLGIQTSYQHIEPTGAKARDQFALGHARLYFSGDVTKNISVMFNTDYNSATDSMKILDAVGQFHVSPKFNVWFGRFLPPSDRDNLTGPFYANEWAVYSDGIQDGYPFVYQGRDNGVAYWGDFKAGVAKIKASVGAFDGVSADGRNGVIWGTRLQIDFWDSEEGYYLNSTYYGEKNLLAISGANEVQSGSTATTIDVLMERKVKGGGAFTIESEYSRYNRLGGYDSNYARSEGAYLLASLLIPKQVGIGKFEALGKYAQAEFTGGFGVPAPNPSYRQKTTEVDFSYIIKQFDARIMAFGKNTSFNAVQKNDWQAGVGLQLQISKQVR